MFVAITNDKWTTRVSLTRILAASIDTGTKHDITFNVPTVSIRTVAFICREGLNGNILKKSFQIST
jgi:hypothetical protein